MIGCQQRGGRGRGAGRGDLKAGHRRAESGQALVEFALVLPVLMIVVLGIFKFGTVFNNYLTLTDAVRSGSRQLALERGQGGADTTQPCVDTVGRVNSAAGGLDVNQLTITVNNDYVSSPGNVSGTCAVLVAGTPSTVSATYPCDLTIFGIDFYPSCKITVSATERTE